MNKITAFFAALALAAAALATQSAAAYGAIAVGAQSGDRPLVARFSIDQPNAESGGMTHAQIASAACDPISTRGSFSTCHVKSLERECFGIQVKTNGNYDSDGPEFYGSAADVGIVSAPIVVADGGDLAAALTAARAAVVASPGSQLVNLGAINGITAGGNVLCDTTPLSTCHTDDVFPNTAGDACISHDPTSCGTDEYSDGGSCQPCDDLNREDGAAGANCGACSANHMHASENDAGSSICTFDPTSCGENEFAESGSCMDSCSELNRATMPGASCGACDEFHSTNSATLGGEADDAAGNHTQCNFAQGLCTGNNRVDGMTCVPCPANHAQDGDDNTMCVFDPGSCTAMQYADSDSCESCNDLNRQAGAAGEFCGACSSGYMHADAIGGDGDACTFDPTSCTDMAQFSPGNTATACGTCSTLNREGATGTSCGACLTNFEHETENDGGITECTAIDGGGDGDFGAVLPMPPDSGVITGAGTEITPYSVPSDSAAADFIITLEIANGSGNHSYIRDDSVSSQELQVGMNDGVVSFAEGANITTATYSIIIDIMDNGVITGSSAGNVIAAAGDTDRVSVYVTVAPAEDTTEDPPCNGGTVTGGVCNCPNNQQEISEGVCGCPSGTTKNQVGVCETNETIACEGGTVTNGECVCPTNTRLNNGRCRTITGDGSTFPVVIPPVDNGKNRDIVALAHGALGVVVISYLFYSNILLDLTWSPAYSFSNNNGNTFYSVGSRWQATSDNWGFYWQTTGDNNQDFAYSSGVRYNNGIFAAAYDGKTDQTETDMQANVSAYKNVGDYDFAAAYYLDAVVDKKKSEIDNRFDLSAAINWQPWRLSAAMSTDGKERQRLNLIANYTIEKWILSATANTNGKSTTTKINYSYRF